MHFTRNTAAVHWCMVTGHLYAEWILIGVNAVAQGCCQLVGHSSTEEQGRHFTLNTAAVVYGDWTPVCTVDLDRCKCSGTRLLSAGLAQQHRRTIRHFTLTTAALVYGDWTPVCKVDLDKCKRSGTRLLSSGLHNSTEEQAGTLP